MKKVVIANDQAAVEIKNIIVRHLEKRGYEVNNLGIDEVISVDYPDMAEEACLEFKKGGYDFGVVCCGTGIGISMSANKIKGIRCALLNSCYAAEMAKKHNMANIIAFGGRVEHTEPVEEILDAFIDNSFEGDRHQRRVDKMMALEKLPD